MSLTPHERELGWAEFECPKHGFLVATVRTAEVKCVCGAAARPSK